MHLKSLTLRGFKSFATSTTMRFEPGINCVVGPNGSGKSNVVDALTWVMGEQGAKNLRGGQMADVIFAGTAKRPALGRAEVSLTIDNTDGILPIEYSEVTISRTLFRSGGSEYAINGTACRLLDIQELLSDTGMGREMHVIIGQGKLDEVLTATPEERRGFIEEAAGVLKHRRRKEKALRKLESMQGNLVRIEDLAAELRRQLGPLARQAATARRAQVIQRDVFDARARLLADDLAQAEARIATQSVDDAAFLKQLSELQERLVAAKTLVAKLEAEVDAANPRIAELTEYWQRLSSLVERFRALEQLAGERQRSLTQAGPNIHRGESPEQIRQRAAQVRAEEEALRKSVQECEDELKAIISRRELAETEERELDTQVVQLNRSLADRRETLARYRGQLETAKTRIESLEAELARVKQAHQAALERVAANSADVLQMEQTAVAHTDGDDTLSIAQEEAARELQEAKEAHQQARKNAEDARGAVVQWTTKAETLALSLTPEDASAWLHDDYRLGVCGFVRDQLKIRAGWEAAVEAALAGIASGVVMNSLDDAVDALRAARESQAGHLEILVETNASQTSNQASKSGTSANKTSGLNPELDSVAEIIAELKLSDSEAVAANGVVETNNETRSAIQSLLAGVALAVDLVTAKKLLDAGVPRVATLAGDVLSKTHVLGGEVQQNTVLARAAAYEDALVQAESAKAEKEAAEQLLTQAAEAEIAATTEFEDLQAQLSARDSQLAAVSAQLGVLRQSLQAAEAEVERNEQRISKITGELEQRRQELADLQAQEANLDAPPEELNQQLTQIQEKRAAAHQETVAARAKETEARLQLRTREERLRAVAGKADALENTAQSVEARIAQEERAAQRRSEMAIIAERIGGNAQEALQFTQTLLQKIGVQREAAQASRLEKDSELSAARRQLENLQTEERTLADLRHRRELAIAQMKSQYEQLSAKAIDDLGTEAKVLIEEFGPHQLIPVEDGEPIPFVREAQEKRLARAERDLVRLGKINPLALEEHAALEERQRYLTEQLQDLKKSREDLLQIVRDIDERVNEVMTSAFEDVAREFTGTFERLFPGGKGQLVLTDPDNILTTGIEIEARPPGKRVKRLSLLSGGERSLTAVAFLVAIFKARPSPFYVMDEVEAALDDVNLSRLIEIFRELQNNSQLLVITHQKRTMEIADTLYGVAMKEQGVTSVISQRLKELEIN
ncbi:MAG: chromosome segregation protein SMC [Arcanobacterium sp.]|nr:chromosome segregation protein SMC [Arcanobacterium sp.]